ncbi:MAG TPA: glycosyltransferase family 4 protein [Dehalococcoidia bacterium]|nr:glycosyltransferase family 4 protein [Dehalococcoidia bacterium]
MTERRPGAASDRPRVLMVSKACYVAAYRQKLTELADIGVDLTLIAPPYWQFRDGRAPFEPGEDRGYRIVLANAAFNGGHHVHFYPGLPRLIAALRPDLLHLDEEPYDLVTYLGLRAAERAGIPAMFFTWQNLDRRFPPPFGWIERYVLRRAAGGQAGNATAAAILRRKGLRGDLAVIPQFGVDPRVFQPAGDRPAERRRGGPAPLRIGYLGRLVPEKGLWVLLEAVAALPGDWTLDIIGSGPLGAELAAAARNRGLDARVRIRPPVGSQAVPDTLRQLDVLVLPSLTTSNWQEQFGRVLIEAMACGLAVVGSDSGEIPHVIGEAGRVVPEGQPDALRSALADLMDPRLRCSLGERGVERVRAHFTHRRIAEDTLALYRRILAPARRRGGNDG